MWYHYKVCNDIILFDKSSLDESYYFSILDLKNDSSRFVTPGINFNAKLIGVDDVENARGDKMCQESMYRLKMAVKSSGQHKQKLIINVSLDGIRIIDLRTHVRLIIKLYSPQ